MQCGPWAWAGPPAPANLSAGRATSPKLSLSRSQPYFLSPTYHPALALLTLERALRCPGLVRTQIARSTPGISVSTVRAARSCISKFPAEVDRAVLRTTLGGPKLQRKWLSSTTALVSSEVFSLLSPSRPSPCLLSSWSF